MLMFCARDGVLAPLEEREFALEDDIQKLIENSLEKLFGLEFVSSKFSVGDFELDTLAFNRRRRTFVIIEYKKKKKEDVYSQALAYLNTMRDRQNDFIVEFNEEKGESLRRKDVDWKAASAILIAPSYTNYQKKSAAKDNRFTLLEIKLFAGDLIAFSEVQPASKQNVFRGVGGDRDRDASDKGRTDSGKASTASGILRRTERLPKPAIPSLVDRSIERIGDIWDKAKEKKAWNEIEKRVYSHPNSSLIAKRSYISWDIKGNKAVAHFYINKNYIQINIRRGVCRNDGSRSKDFFDLNDPEGLALEKNWNYKYKNRETDYKYSIDIHDHETADRLDYIFSLLKQKYDSILGETQADLGAASIGPRVPIRTGGLSKPAIPSLADRPLKRTGAINDLAHRLVGLLADRPFERTGDIQRQAKEKKIWAEVEKRIRDYPDSSLKAKKRYIRWDKESTAVAYFKIMKNGIRAEVLRGSHNRDGRRSKGFFDLYDPESLALERSWTYKDKDKGSGYKYSIDIADDETSIGLDYIFSLLKQKYDSI